MKQLFEFLQMELCDNVLRLAQQVIHTDSIGRWKSYKKHIQKGNSEDIEAIFDGMEPELELLGYTE